MYFTFMRLSSQKFNSSPKLENQISSIRIFQYHRFSFCKTKIHIDYRADEGAFVLRSKKNAYQIFCNFFTGHLVKEKIENLTHTSTPKKPSFFLHVSNGTNEERICQEDEETELSYRMDIQEDLDETTLTESLNEYATLLMQQGRARLVALRMMDDVHHEPTLKSAIPLKGALKRALTQRKPSKQVSFDLNQPSSPSAFCEY